MESPVVEVIHSLKESKVEKVIRKSSTHLLKYCETKLIRTYPDNFRIDSSNYDPLPAWNYGCQVVALNYQTSVHQKYERAAENPAHSPKTEALEGLA
jgi:hypothetical protein